MASTPDIINVMKDGKLRDRSTSRESKETGKTDAMCGSELDSGPEKKK